MHFIELLSLRGIKKTWNFIMNFSCVFLGDTFISQFSYGFHKWTTHPKSRLFSYISCISVFTKKWVHWTSIFSPVKFNLNFDDSFKNTQESRNKVTTLCLKITQNVAFDFSILAFFTNFCPIKIDMTGNTVLLQTSGFQKFVKMDNFWHF